MNEKELRKELNEVEKDVSTLSFSISKAVPWSLIGVIALQSMGLFYWAGQMEATQTAHIKIAEERHSNLLRQLDDRYRGSQARSDIALLNERIAHNAQANVDFSRALDKLTEQQERRFQELFDIIRTTHGHRASNGVDAP